MQETGAGGVVGGQSLTGERTGNEGDPAISSDGRQRSDKFMAFPTDLFPGPRWPLLRIADYSRSNFREEIVRKEVETRDDHSLSENHRWAKFNKKIELAPMIYRSKRNVMMNVISIINNYSR